MAEAEARVHGTTVDQIHFHDVGPVDAIAWSSFLLPVRRIGEDFPAAS